MGWFWPMLFGLVVGWFLFRRRQQPVVIKHLWKGPAYEDATWKKVNLTRNPSARPLIQMQQNLKTAFPDLTLEQQTRIGIYAYWWANENTKNDALTLEAAMETVVSAMEAEGIEPVLIEEMKSLRNALTALAQVAHQGQAHVAS